MISYNPDDVRKVAQAVLEIEPELVEGGRQDYRWCHFCQGKQRVTYTLGKENPSTEKFPHKPDCTVLIAQDLLTERK